MPLFPLVLVRSRVGERIDLARVGFAIVCGTDEQLARVRSRLTAQVGSNELIAAPIVGTGTPGSAGFAPAIHAVEPSLLGTADFSVAISGARAGGNAGLFVSLGQDPGGTPFQGATLHVLRGAGTRFLSAGPLAGTGATGGFGSISFRLPRSSAFLGTRLYAQWLVVDPHVGGNCSATRAVEILLF